jgi:hypothetical protein
MLLGPVPDVGMSVRVIVEGGACREDGRQDQVLRVHPPWGGESAELVLSNSWTRAEGILTRENDTPSQATTGAYRLTSAYPYDPAAAGIRGFDSDLGALIHRIRIEPVVEK